MKIRLEKLLLQAQSQQSDLLKQAEETNSFALRIAAQSMESHIVDLKQQLISLSDKAEIELIEFRFVAPQVNKGSMPLHIVSKAAEEIRQMIGYAALRISQGGLRKKRIPGYLYEDLDLRLTGLLPGSSRLLVSAAANRDLFDEGISKTAIGRIFSVLESQGKGKRFLEAVTDLGPFGAKSLRNFIHLANSTNAKLDFTWRYSGKEVLSWAGSEKALKQIEDALDITELSSKEEVNLEGIIELLSKRERMHLLSDSNEAIKILFPKRMLDQVAGLHLNQRVKLRCSVTETANPHTGEASIFYELIDILG